MTKISLPEKIKDLTENRTFHPTMAMIFYQSTQAGQENKRYSYIESSQIIKNNEGKYHLSNSKPISHELLSELKEYVENTSDKAKLKFEGLMPEKVLYFNQKVDGFRLMWLVSGGKRKLFFTENLGIPDGEYLIPDLIFDFEGEEGNVWAAVRDEVYHAPMLNISENGSLCFGNVKRMNKGVKSYETFMNKTEAMFFGSRFSHGANEECLTEPIIPFYQTVLPTFIHQNQWSKFLVSTKKKIKDLI